MMLQRNEVPTILQVLLVLLLVIGMGSSYLVDMKRLSTPQVETMQKLKDLIEQEELDVEPYIKENYSLAKWLYYYGFNLEATIEALRKNVRWRAEENISNVLKEDWSDMRQRFPYTLDTCDKEGRPIQYIEWDRWDIAGYLAEGKHAEDRFFRYMIMWREEAEALVWEWFKAGKYVTQGTIIFNLAGFSTQKHLSLACLQTYRMIGVVIEPNYPNTRSTVIGVDTPFIFRAAYWVMTPLHQNQMVLFGYDRSQWEPYLLDRIAPEEMPKGLLEPGSPTFQGGFAEQKYVANRVKPRSPTHGETPYPFSFPGSSLPEGVLRWKREL